MVVRLIVQIAPELSKLRAIIQYTDVVSDDIRNGQVIFPNVDLILCVSLG